MLWRSFSVAIVLAFSNLAYAVDAPPPPPEKKEPEKKEPEKKEPEKQPEDKAPTSKAPTDKPADWVDAPAAGEKPKDGKPVDPNAPKTTTPDDKFGTEEDGTPAEKKEGTRYFLGARFRNFVIPAFMFDLFASGGPDIVNVFSGGPEFMLHTGALEVLFSVTVPYADFSMDEFIFKSKSDPDRAYEFASSSLKLITASVDLLGRIKFDDKGTVALLLGGGVGISGVLGSIFRTQAYPNDPNNLNPDDVTQWSKCEGPGDGPQDGDGQNYCGDDNNHYPDADGNPYSEPSWTNGGSKPVVFPYVALPHIALEVTPVDEFMVRLDTGFSITGFFFGLGAGGRLPI
jgi:hypothetical protein